MPSRSWQRWAGERAGALDEVATAHAAVGGTERGRRYATQQINFAYAALLSGHFQGFCRDLHTECVDAVVAVLPAQFRDALRQEMIRTRTLDRGNPHPGGIGADFGRFGFDFWPDVYALDARNDRRRELLRELIEWRNAIAHQDFEAVAPGGVPSLHPSTVRGWRRAVSVLARSFDAVMYNYLRPLLGHDPW